MARLIALISTCSHGIRSDDASLWEDGDEDIGAHGLCAGDHRARLLMDTMEHAHLVNKRDRKYGLGLSEIA